LTGEIHQIANPAFPSEFIRFHILIPKSKRRDSEGRDEVKSGHRILSNPEALADSMVQVKEFLAKHLK
jgi:hypothetical protein